MDKHRNFAELQQKEPSNSYSVFLRSKSSRVAIIAPHGGGIEPGTLEIANHIAGSDLSFYAFDGHKSRGNGDLHITSTHFDEPQCLAILRESNIVVAIHGCEGDQGNTYIGGRDEVTREKISYSLQSYGFNTYIHPDINLQGLYPDNICNRGATGCGVQLELDRALRQKMFIGLSREQRNRTTEVFKIFAKAIQQALRDK